MTRFRVMWYEATAGMTTVSRRLEPGSFELSPYQSHDSRRYSGGHDKGSHMSPAHKGVLVMILLLRQA